MAVRCEESPKWLVVSHDFEPQPVDIVVKFLHSWHDSQGFLGLPNLRVLLLFFKRSKACQRQGEKEVVGATGKACRKSLCGGSIASRKAFLFAAARRANQRNRPGVEASAPSNLSAPANDEWQWQIDRERG